jgi:carbonic anhydrase
MKIVKPIFVFAWFMLPVLFLSSCGQKPAESTSQSVVADSLTAPAKPVSARPVHWGYGGDVGPSTWSTLSPSYAMCAEGKHQSPVNIVKTDVKGGSNWNLDYSSTSLHIAHTEHMEDIVDNGHTIQVTVDEGSLLTYNGKAYALKQFHFHTPSEHTLDGKNQPMEMHMVHQSADGSLAVLGVFFKEGKVANPNFEKIIANLPGAKGESKHITDTSFELDVFMPSDNFAYHYTGSLTTPPCSENVQWLVLRDMISLTKEQINAFSSRIGPNNRPTQALNDRTINMDDVKGK